MECDAFWAREMGVDDFADFSSFSFLTAQIPLTPLKKLTIWLLGKSHRLDLMTRFSLKFLFGQPQDNLPSTVGGGLGTFHSYSFRVFLALAYYSLKVKIVSLLMDIQPPDNQNFLGNHTFLPSMLPLCFSAYGLGKKVGCILVTL